MWSLFNRRRIEGIRKPLNNKPPSDLPSPHRPRLHHYRRMTKKIVSTLTAENTPLNVAAPSTPRPHCKTSNTLSYPARATVPQVKIWIPIQTTPGEWALDRPAGQGCSNRCRERRTMGRKFQSSTHPSRAVSVGQRRVFQYILAISADQRRPLQEPSI
jgi:hypothetical protein